MAYDKPEHPPPCTPTRRPPTSADTPSFASNAMIFFAARSVICTAGPIFADASWIFVSVAIDLYRTLWSDCQILSTASSDGHETRRRKDATNAAQSLA